MINAKPFNERLDFDLIFSIIFDENPNEPYRPVEFLEMTIFIIWETYII